MGLKTFCLALLLATTGSFAAENADSRQPNSPPGVLARSMNCCNQNYSAEDCAADAHGSDGAFSCLCRETMAISGNPEVKSYTCAGKAGFVPAPKSSRE